MTTKTYSILASLIIALSCGNLWACPPQPPMLTGAANITQSANVGQTVTFNGENVFYCPDGGTIEEYQWILPEGAFFVTGSRTKTLKCKFSPAGVYTVELRVKCSHGLWNIPSEESYTATVTVSSSSGPWYVSPNGNDDNNGLSSSGVSPAGPFRTIQVAIESAIEGQEIIVEAGSGTNPVIYYEQINVKNKNLNIHSTDPEDWEAVQNTIIDANKQGTAVMFGGTETSLCQLSGFTIRGGFPTEDALALDLTFDHSQESGSDSSGKERNGILVGAQRTDSGRFGGGVSFDGIDDYIRIENYKGVLGRCSRTVSVWIKPEGTGSPTICSWGSIEDGKRWMVTLTSNGGLALGVWGGRKYSNINLRDGNWHHVAVILDGDSNPNITEAKLYVDGIEDTNAVVDNCIGGREIFTEDGGDVIVGARFENDNDSDADYCYTGKMDEFKIFSRVLTQTEIKNLTVSPVLPVHLKLDGNIINASGSQSDVLGIWGDQLWISDGRLDGALELDGDGDYITLADGILNPAETSFSIFAWVRPDEASISTYQAIIQQFDLGVNVGRTLLLRTSDNKLSSSLGGSPTTSSEIVFSQADQWYHVGVTYDGQEVVLYANGQEVGSAYKTAEFCAGGFIIGRHKTDTATYWDGTLDDLQIYKRVLSPEEIRQIASHHEPVAHWTLDETTGPSVDCSIHAISGTWMNGPTSSSEGYLNRAMEFDGGNDYIATNYSGILGNRDRTVSAWIKAVPQTVTTSETVLRSIVSWGGDTTGGTWNLAVNYVANEGPHGTIRLAANASKVVGTTRIDDNRWHHVAAVFSNDGTPTVSDIQLYIDGKKEVISYKVEAPLNTGTGMNVAIGAVDYPVIPPSGPKFYFKGKIDDVRIYDRALPEAELYQMYGVTLGGGIHGSNSSATISSCIIRDNESLANGGGAHCFDGTIRNCLLMHNTTFKSGGAISESLAEIRNCTIVSNVSNVSNSTLSGGGLYACTGDIINNILWQNTPNQIVNCPWVYYNCIQGWTLQGDGNISDNPLFINPSLENYQLLSSSPCIDAGDPGSIYINEPENNGDRVNLGVFGNTVYAEIADDDGDNDGDQIPDWWETLYGLNPQDSTDAGQYSAGSDGHLTNLQEYQAGTNPNLSDTDGDGIPDWWELLYDLDPLDSADAGQDSAGSDGHLTNLEEYWAGTNPNQVDSDTDTMPDWWEIAYGLDPTSSADATHDDDGDGLTHAQEYGAGTHPLHHNTESGITEYDYDDYGRMTCQTIHDGQATSIVYAVTEYDYDELGRQWRQRSYKDTGTGNSIQDDMITLTVYDVQGNAKMTVRKTDETTNPGQPENGDLVVLNKYYASGMIQKTIQGTYSTTPNPDGDNVASPKETEYIYQNNQLYQVKAPKHGLSESDRAVTTYYYDNAGRNWKIVEATNHYRVKNFDSLGNLIKETAYQSDNTPRRQVRSEFDDLGRLKRRAVMASAAALDTQVIQTTVDQVTDYYYDTDGGSRYYPGQLVAKTIYYTTSGTPATTYFDYDELERQVVATDPDLNCKSVAYDNMNRVRHLVDFSTNQVAGKPNLVLSTRQKYDSSGRLKQVIQEENPLDETTWRNTYYTYDAADRKRREVKPNEVFSEFDYNGWGSLTKQVADAAAGGFKQTTTYDYDRLGRQDTIDGYTGVGEAGTKQRTTYSYTDLDKVEQIRYPDSQTITYAYYDNGMVKTRTDQRDLVTTYAYDVLGVNLLTKTVTQDLVTTVESFTYDALGRIKTAAKTENSNPVSSSVFDYFDTGLMQSEQQTLFGGAARTVSYAYDPAGYRRQTVYPTATTFNRTNDWQGRINVLTLGPAFNVIADYDYVGSRTSRRTYGVQTSQIVTDYAYDALGRLGEINSYHTLNGIETPLVQFAYDHAPMEDNITQQTFMHRQNDPENEYGYDDLDRLTSVQYLSDDTDIEDFTNMDNLGNRVGTVIQRDNPHSYAAASSNLSNRYTSIDSQPLLYDDAGSLTLDKAGYHYVYDYENRITRIYKLDGQTEITVARFAYDALGRRIMKEDSLNTANTRYYYYNDTWQIVTEYDLPTSEGVYKQLYAYGNYIDEVVYASCPGATYTMRRYLHDHLYSPAAIVYLTASSCILVERSEYDAYGAAHYYNADYTQTFAVSQHGNPFAFTGREIDSFDNNNLKNMYYRNRYYNFQMGRFLQRDPIQYVDSMNLYCYVTNNPINYIDSFGLEKIKDEKNVPITLDLQIPYLDVGISLKGYLFRSLHCCLKGKNEGEKRYVTEIKVSGSVSANYEKNWADLLGTFKLARGANLRILQTIALLAEDLGNQKAAIGVSVKGCGSLNARYDDCIEKITYTSGTFSVSAQPSATIDVGGTFNPKQIEEILKQIGINKKMPDKDITLDIFAKISAKIRGEGSVKSNLKTVSLIGSLYVSGKFDYNIDVEIPGERPFNHKDSFSTDEYALFKDKELVKYSF